MWVEGEIVLWGPNEGVLLVNRKLKEVGQHVQVTWVIFEEDDVNTVIKQIQDALEKVQAHEDVN